MSLPLPPSRNAEVEGFEPLPARAGWVHKVLSEREAVGIFTGIPCRTPTGIPSLKGIQHRYILNYNAEQLSSHGKKRKGWPRPGPGPKRGVKKLASLDSLEGPFVIAVCFLIREALCLQMSFSQGNTQEQASEFHSQSAKMAELCSNLQVHNSIRKKMWPLASQLGVPSFLVKLTSPHHAIAMYLIRHQSQYQWWCSKCTTTEIDLSISCDHAITAGRCLETVTALLGYSREHVIDMLNRFAECQQLSELSNVCFYGESSKLEFAVVRTGLQDISSPIDSSNRVHIVHKAQKWRCLGLSCYGISSFCYHSKVTRTHVEHAERTSFRSMFERDGTEFIASGNEGAEDIISPRHHRPMIPSDQAFVVDREVNLDARIGNTRTIPAASSCHCGSTRQDHGSSSVYDSELRVEAARCHVTYIQQTWSCVNGHLVLPEEDAATRDGLVWLSKDTAFTEAYLFDILLHLTFSGSTIASQADIRSQLLSLQMDYVTGRDIPRSHLSLRKALIIYAMSVVKGMPDWVFRCQKCALFNEQGIYYDKLSFDGQQLGFNIKHDVRYDFYGGKVNKWTRPVERCTKAWQLSHLIEAQSLRGIVMEALRVREVPAGCNSVHSLCRLMMNVSLHNKETICAAIAAIKLFDPEWVLHANAEGVVDISSYDGYVNSYALYNCAHPIEFISSARTVEDFERGRKVMNIFRNVVDARRGAAILSVLLRNLRRDLKDFIPSCDVSFVETYSEVAYESLHSWLVRVTEMDGEAATLTMRELQENMPSGVPEHAEKLEHPYRPPWSWVRVSVNVDTGTPASCLQRMVCRVYDVGPWKCPTEATARLLLLVMALLTEPMCVWMRSGSFSVLAAAVEVLQNAEQYSGEGNSSFHYRAAFHDLKKCVLLYEGIMAVVGANTSDARGMFSSLSQALQCVFQKYTNYEQLMEVTRRRKSFTLSPNDFDDMLCWTGAFGDNNEGIVEGSYEAIMRTAYQNLATCQGTDFLETGVWAPDFPIRRPSPADIPSGSEANQADRSCSKNFQVDSAFSPGTFGGYCLCKHAKTVILLFLKRPEGCRMPLNFVVERCSQLPTYMVYDFACGTQKAALGMSKEIVRNMNFVIDPFHFPGHKTCSLAMHQSSYSDLFGCNTESQEQRNKGIKVMDKTLRGCRDVHFMHFVVLAHAYLNLKSMFHDNHDANVTRLGSRAWLRWVKDNLF